jgi:hypothetical protein
MTMEFTVFWSWQSDAPNDCNRKFIRDALNKAVKEIANAKIVEDPRVESGMENVPGTLDVAQIMFDKIGKSDAIVDDVSLVGRILDGKLVVKKKIPNPNVMAEMGYAAGHMGWERVICVMNEFYGTRDELPFDVKSKRHPVDYTLAPNDLAKAEVKKNLSNDLKKAIQCCIDAEHRAVIDALRRMDILCITVCSFFGHKPFFPDINHIAPPELREYMLQYIDVTGFRLAIQRLIDIGILRSELHDNQDYAYHWTYRGRCLLEELKKKNAFKEPPAVSITRPNA